MIYHDPIYGRTRIQEPVVLDLMASKAMQRLQGVLQHGVSALVGVTRPTSRYEHSIGVMLLVKRYGGSLDEQVAALIHDVSHTAFSHVIDYVFGSHDTQGFHEDRKLEYISNTDIPMILSTHGYDWMNFMEEGAFPLLEQDLPHLCADRLDYFLRDARGLNLASEDEISDALSNLTPFQGRIVASDLDVARWLGYTFIQADQASWANFREVGLYELAALAIRRGLEIGVLSEEDIWGEDVIAWEKLRTSPDAELQHHFSRVHADTRFVWDEGNPDFWVSTKLRSIDPDVLVDGQAVPLSSLDHNFADHRRSYLTRNSGKWPMRVVE